MSGAFARVTASYPRCRKWTLVSILCGVTITDLAARAEIREYEIDPEHLTVGFLAEHIGSPPSGIRQASPAKSEGLRSSAQSGAARRSRA